MPSSNLTFLVICKPTSGIADNSELARYYDENKNAITRIGESVFVFDPMRDHAVLEGFRQRLKSIGSEFIEFEKRAGDTDFFVRGGFNKETEELLSKHSLLVSNIFPRSS
jgi:hypothetical protein